MKQIQYRDAVVTFIDILGFKDMISNLNENTINDILQLFHLQYNQDSLSDQSDWGKTYTTEIHFFSDSVVRVKYTDEDEEFLNAVTDEIISLAVMQLELLKHDILIRGGCTRGMVYSNLSSNVLFGPALMEAYNIEKDLSVYPRIVISDNVWNSYMRDMASSDSWVKSDGGANRGFDFMKTSSHKYITGGWKKDAGLMNLKYNKFLSDQWFINYFWGPITAKFYSLRKAENFFKHNLLSYQKNFVNTIEMYLTLLESYNRKIEIKNIDEKIKIKHLWCRFQLHETIKDIYEWIDGLKLSFLFDHDQLKKISDQAELFFKRYALWRKKD
jgi:hypothetical protein